MNSVLDVEIRRSIAAANRVLVVSHIRPDGDAVGSASGLGMCLQQAGKDVQVVLSDGVPPALRHIAGASRITRHAEGPFDLVIVVDCSDLERTGKALENLPAPDINIDHHITNLEFARLNLVEPVSVATSAVITSHLEAWGLELSPEAASAFLSGLVSDTIGFRTSNMNSEALRLAARLVDLGADLPSVYSQALLRRSFSAARYWGCGLDRLQQKGRLVWTSLTLADREAAGYPGNDDADLINILSAIDEADIALIFVEQRGGRTKVSWRASPEYDVSSIAMQFGGGGHMAASGADIPGGLEEVQAAVLEVTGQLLVAAEEPQQEAGG